MNCETCEFYEYDEDDEAYYCTVNMDEDDYARLLSGHRTDCPYYRSDDDYRIVRHQI